MAAARSPHSIISRRGCQAPRDHANERRNTARHLLSSLYSGTLPGESSLRVRRPASRLWPAGCPLHSVQCLFRVSFVSVSLCPVATPKWTRPREECAISRVSLASYERMPMNHHTRPPASPPDPEAVPPRVEQQSGAAPEDAPEARTPSWAAEELYRTIVSTANEGIWLIDRAGCTVFVNERLAGWLDEDARAMVGRAVQEFCFPADRPAARARIARNFAGHFEQFDFRFRRHDGTALPVLACTSPVRDRSGAISGALGLFTDLRARHQAQRELRESEQRLRAILEVLPVGVAFVDATGKPFLVNDMVRQIWGQDLVLAENTAEYGVYKGWWPESGLPLDGDEWGLARSLAEGAVILSEELHIEAFDGQRKTILSSSAPLRDAAGMIAGAVSAIVDITERRRLGRQARWQASMLDRAHDAIFMWEWDGPIIYWNQGAVQLYGFTQEEAIGQISHDLLRTEIPGARSALEAELERTGEWSGELIHTTHDGRQIAVLSRHQILREPGGRRVVLETSHDITERQALERRTRESLEGLLALAEALVVPSDAGEEVVRRTATEPGPHDEAPRRLAALCQRVLATDRVALITVQPEDERLYPAAILGASPEQATAWRAGFGSMRLTERFGAATAARLRRGEAVVVRMDDLAPADPAHLLSSRHFLMAPMLAEGALVGYIGVNFGERTSDYTAERIALALGVAQLIGIVLERDRLLREHEESLARVLALEETTRRMDEFMGIASHEIRTPITGLQSTVQLSELRLKRLRAEMLGERKERADPAPTRQQAKTGRADEWVRQVDSVLKLYAAMRRQIARQNRLVSDLVDTARIRAGELQFHFGACDLGALVREVIAEQREAWPHRAITQRVPRAPVVTAHCDADRVEQVLINMLTNALKYSDDDQPVAMRLRVVDEVARIEVTDHGPGLPPDEYAHVWERFHRVPGVSVRSGSGVGLGLGLYISKAIVDRHGGEVGVRSVPGAGATFWFTIPLADPPAGAAPAGDSTSSPPNGDTA